MASIRVEMDDQFNHNRRVPNHDCQLPEDENVIIRYIHSGCFVTCRRVFKKFLMVSASDPQAQQILKSTTKIRLEEIRHLDHYYYMIHPFSEGRFYWECFMIFIYALQMIVTPLASATRLPSPLLTYVEMGCFIYIVLDMILSLSTGYLAKKTQKIVLYHTKVIKNYMLGYFFVDLIGFFPVNMAALYINLDPESATQMTVFYIFRLLLLVRLLRIPTMLKYIKKFCERMGIWGEPVRIMTLLLSFAIVILWATVIQTFLSVLRTPLNFQELRDIGIVFPILLESCHQVVMIFMLIGPVVIADDTKEMVFQTICLLLGSIINMIILAKIMQIYYMHSKAKNKYNTMVQQISEYMKYKELPESLRAKVFRYLDFRFQKHIFKESQVLNTVSTILKEDILMHNCKRMVEKVDFFKELPTPLILRILDRLKTEIYLPGDVIVQAGIVGNAMYFLYLGKVAVYTKQGQEICHLQDGSHFGEIALVINQPRIATVIAISNCEVFRLSRKDFQEAVEPYPELCSKIRTSALERLRSTNQFETANTRVTDSTVVLADNETASPKPVEPPPIPPVIAESFVAANVIPKPELDPKKQT